MHDKIKYLEDMLQVVANETQALREEITVLREQVIELRHCCMRLDSANRIYGGEQTYGNPKPWLVNYS